VSRRAVTVRVLLALALASPARAAGEAAGTAAGSFLSVGTGTSVLSMAGATLASGRDLAAASWNVASLARVDALTFSLAHAPLPGGATQDWLAGGGRLGRTGTLSVNNLALGASLAQPLGEFVTAGAGVEWVHESLAGTNGSGVGFSAGLRADAGPVGVALAARRLGGTMRYASASYDLPQVVAAGVSWTDAERGLRVNADFESPRHYYNSVRVGGEWTWRDRVATRAGYRLALAAPSEATASGPAFGIGAGVGSVWMDYAFVLDGGTTAGEHRVGLTFRPGFPGLGGGAQRARAVVTTPTPSPAATASERPKPAVTALPPAAKAAEQKPAAMRSPPTAPPSPSPAPKNSAAPQPAPAASSQPPASNPGPTLRPTWIVVAPGETLGSLAQRWDTTVAAIMEANNLVRDRVAPGKQLKLPPARPRP
jgi:LysM repeat protein